MNRRRAAIAIAMGLWLAASFPGEILGGWLGGFWSEELSRIFLLSGCHQTGLWLTGDNYKGGE